jgi:hypothetical protein
MIRGRVESKPLTECSFSSAKYGNTGGVDVGAVSFILVSLLDRLDFRGLSSGSGMAGLSHLLRRWVW